MTDSGNLEALARWRVWNGHRAVWRLFFTVVLTLVFALLILRGSAEDPRKNLVASQAELAALVQAAVPDSENAALDYERAFKAYSRKFMGPSADHPLDNLSREGSFFDDRMVLAYYVANKPALAAIDAAVLKERCVWKIDYVASFNASLGHNSELRHAAWLLALRARISAHKGDHAAAAASIKSAFKVAAHLRSERLLIHGIWRCTILRNASEALQAILLYDTPARVDEIAAYRDAIKMDGSPYDDFAHVFEGEAAWERVQIDTMASGQSNQVFAATDPRELFALSFLYGTELKTHRAVTEEVLQRARRGEIMRNPIEIIQRNLKGPSVMTAQMLPAIERTELMYLREADTRLCADTALAVLQFRIENGRDPKSLEELVKQFWPAVPVDWYSHKPLRIRVEEQAIQLKSPSNLRATLNPNLPPGTLRVYSCGENGKDNLGRNHTVEKLAEPLLYQDKLDDSVIFLPPMKK